MKRGNLFLVLISILFISGCEPQFSFSNNECVNVYSGYCNGNPEPIEDGYVVIGELGAYGCKPGFIVEPQEQLPEYSLPKNYLRPGPFTTREVQDRYCHAPVINGCLDGIDNNGNGFIDTDDSFCEERSRDFTNCELLFGDSSFSIVDDGGECRGSCGNGYVSVTSPYGNLPAGFDEGDGNGLSNLDLCGIPSLKCCIVDNGEENEIHTLSLCIYGEQQTYAGCTITDLEYCYDDGSCYLGTTILTADIFGCTDNGACNYDSSASADDGTCEYPEEFYNCNGNCNNDISPQNGVCDELENYGCTDQFACNYNSATTVNDGTCEYPEENYDCEGNCIGLLDCNGVCGGDAVLAPSAYGSKCCIGEDWVDDCGICRQLTEQYCYDENNCYNQSLNDNWINWYTPANWNKGFCSCTCPFSGNSWNGVPVSGFMYHNFIPGNPLNQMYPHPPWDTLNYGIAENGVAYCELNADGNADSCTDLCNYWAANMDYDTQHGNNGWTTGFECTGGVIGSGVVNGGAGVACIGSSSDNGDVGNGLCGETFY